ARLRQFEIGGGALSNGQRTSAFNGGRFQTGQYSSVSLGGPAIYHGSPARGRVRRREASPTLLPVARAEYDDQECRDWTDEEGANEPAEAGATLALGQAGVDQGQCPPADDISGVRFHSMSLVAGSVVPA